jgi:hypothetical protein
MSGSDDEAEPPSTKPTPSGAYRKGQQAKRDREGVASNPYVGPDGDQTAAREWVRGFLDEAALTR